MVEKGQPRGEGSQVRRFAIVGGELVAWWLACTGVWLATLSSVPSVQLYTATSAALPCGILAAAARRVAGNAWQVRPAWWKAGVLLPLAIITDSAQLFSSVLPGRVSRGERVRRCVPGTVGETPAANWHRALATWLVCATPSTFVVDFDPRTGEAVVHRLRVRGPSTLAAVASPREG